jgi:hypothetical protein
LPFPNQISESLRNSGTSSLADFADRFGIHLPEDPWTRQTRSNQLLTAALPLAIFSSSRGFFVPASNSGNNRATSCGDRQFRKLGLCR